MYITLQKKDLRFSCGADIDNRHGLYLVKRLPDGTFEMVAGTGDWGRREVTLEVELSPLPDGAPYLLVVSARIGNVKFEEVPYCITIQSEHPLKSADPLPVTNVPDLIKTMITWLRLHYDNQRVLESSIYGLCHLSHFKENRPIIAEVGGISLLCDIIKDYMTEWQMLKEVLSLVWDMSCDLGVRKLFNDADMPSLIQIVKEKHYSNVELQEVVEVTMRNLSLEKGIAMDPLIEKCILVNACTFCVTGSKSYLLQSWHDCYTCNLRTRCGICSVCVETCHKGHKISAPKFSRFFCDCGHGKLIKAVKCNAIKDMTQYGLEKKREKDEFYDSDEDDPGPLPNPFLPGPKIDDRKRKRETGGRKVHTLFDN